MPAVVLPPIRKLSPNLQLLLMEIADFSPVKRLRTNGYVSRRHGFFPLHSVAAAEARGLLEVLHENPARLVLTDEGRRAIGLQPRGGAA